ncbi:2-keto-3-deoxy-L-rhamnonate aldolase RhmA [Bradyrhizobium sp. GM24.11]
MSEAFAKRLSARKKTLFGTWVKIPAIEVVELLAHAGFDYIVLDMEHAPLTLDVAYRATVVAQGMGLGVLVRVPDRSGSLVQRLLDSGVDGLLVPRVTSPDIAAAAIESMMFEPNGRRGLGITSRAGRWGQDSADAYINHGRDAIVRGIQIEDRDALEAIEAIAATPGLNAVFIGMGDLALSTGLPPSHPEIETLVKRVLDVCHKRNLPCGTAVGTVEAARQCRDRGFGFVMVNNDASMLGKVARDLCAGLAA